MAEDPVLDALDHLMEVLEANEQTRKEMIRRGKALHAARAKGLSYREIVPHEKRPLIVEMLRTMQEGLTAAGFALRSAEASALREEGMTLDQIASLFGVTRQRVIALVRGAQKD